MGRKNAEYVVKKLNQILKVRPFPDAVMLDEYESLMRSLDDGEWGVLVDTMEKRNGKIFATVKVAAKDSEEYRRIFS